MNNALGVSDPTDWSETSLPAFAPVDAAIRCQVCKDFFTNAVITSCAHTFCSLCIRRCLAADGRCPSCRANEQDVRLRRNVAVQELTDAFVAARPQALRLAQRGIRAGEPEDLQDHGRGQKRKREAKDDGLDHAPRRSQRLQSNEKLPRTTEVTIGDSEDEEEDQEDPAYMEEPQDGLVACPVCNKRMKAEAVFSHLDMCESEMETAKVNRRPPQNSAPLPSQTFGLRRQSPAEPKPALERLPQLNYSLLKDNALRKKLSELGISSAGVRPLLIRRHTEWINLWNANCDSARPRTRKELLGELDSWERSQGGRAIDGGQGSGLAKEVMRKDFDGDGWVKKNKGDFDQLIADARKKRAVPKSTTNSESEMDKEGIKHDVSASMAARREPTIISHHHKTHPTGTLPNPSTFVPTLDISNPPSIFSPPSHHRNRSKSTSEPFTNPGPHSERTTPSIFSPPSLQTSNSDSRPDPSKSPVPGFSFEKSLHHLYERDINTTTIPDPLLRPPPAASSILGSLSEKSQHHLYRDDNGAEGSAPTSFGSYEESGTSSRDGHAFVPPSLRKTTESESSLPGRLTSSEGVVRRRPMFEVPSNPVADAETSSK